MRILVTGATGNVGRLVVNHLVGKNVEVRALTVDPVRAALPDGVEVARGYLGNPDSLRPALEGVDRMYLAPLPRTVTTVVNLARQAGVQRVVALTSSNADQEAAGDPSTWHNYAVERAVEASGIPEWTHLRAGEFMANMLDWADMVRDGVIRSAYGNAAYAPIDLDDIAAVAAAALLEDGHHGQKYDLTGPESLTKYDRVRILSNVLGREISFEELTRADARELMLSRGYGDVTDWLLDSDAAGVEHPQAAVPTVQEVTGRRAMTFAEWVSRNAAAFA
jgi:uncharacterized protein YbjT (DUF2867 family)